MPKGYGLSEATKDGIWELRAEGLSESRDRAPARPCPPTVCSYLARIGRASGRGRGRRPEKCLSLDEREEISREIAGGRSARAIARALRRSHTTIAREIDRCGGRRRYRAQAKRTARLGAARDGRGGPSSSSARSCAGSSQSGCERTTPPSRSRAGSGSNTPTMRRCGSLTRRSTAPSTSRRGGRSSESSAGT